MPSQRRQPTLTQLVSPLLAGAAVLAVAASLSGCSAIMNALHHQHEERFADYSHADAGWVGVEIPHWIPSDATDIRNVATDNEIDAVIRVVSAKELSSECHRAERVGLPFTSSSAIPALGTLPDHVQRCGDYEVVAVSDGWLGWYQGRDPGDTPTAG